MIIAKIKKAHGGIKNFTGQKIHPLAKQHSCIKLVLVVSLDFFFYDDNEDILYSKNLIFLLSFWGLLTITLHNIAGYILAGVAFSRTKPVFQANFSISICDIGFRYCAALTNVIDNCG